MSKLSLLAAGAVLTIAYIHESMTKPKVGDWASLDWKTVSAAQVGKLLKSGLDVGGRAINPGVADEMKRAGMTLPPGRSTPLMFAAAYSDDPAVVEALIKAGSDVNADGDRGYTPLIWAAKENKNPAVVEALIKAGADVNGGVPSGTTPLMFAALFNDNPAVVGALLNGGADPAARNEGGLTPLMFAVANGNPAVAEAVLDAVLAAGGDVNARDDGGETAFDRAAENPRLKGSDVYRRLESLKNGG